MQIITLLNEKGGVGKTTLSTHLAAGLALRGRKVLLIDGDPQGHATVSMGLKKAPGIYDLLIRNESTRWQDVLVVPDPILWAGDQATEGRLWVLRGNKETRAIPMNTGDSSILMKRLEEVRTYFDVCVIDTPPTPSMLHAMIYLATDYIIYPTELEHLSLDGLHESMQNMKRASAYYEQQGLSMPLIVGYQPNMFESRVLSHQKGLTLLRQQYRDDVFAPIAKRTVWTQASYLKRTLYSYVPEDVATNEAWRFVGRVERVLAS